MPAVSSTLLSLLMLSPFPGGWLGVYLAGENERAVVAEVIPGSPAAQAGVEAGDVLLAIDGKAIRSQADLRERIAARAAGSKIELKVRRGDAERVLEVRLGEQPADGESGAGAPAAPPAATRPGRPAMPAPGSEAAPSSGATPAGRGYLGIAVRETDRGVVVDRVVAGGPAAAAGVVAGEGIASLAGQPITDLQSLDAALETVRPDQRVEMQLLSDRGKRSLVVVAGRRSTAGAGAAGGGAGGGSAGGAPAVVEVAPVQVTPPPPPMVLARPVPATAEAFDLERELRELRAELAEMRRILQAMQAQQERQQERQPEAAEPPARRQRRGR